MWVDFSPIYSFLPRVMLFHKPYHWVIGLFAVLFLLCQSIGIAHSAEFGDAPHEHDGIACEIQTVTFEQDVVLPVLTITHELVSYTASTEYDFIISAVFQTPQTRAPPPRAPPLTF